MPIFVIEIVIEFFRRSNARSEKFWLKSAKKINHRTNTAIFYVTVSTVQKIGRAAQTDFIREVGGAYEYLWRNNQYYLASDTVITNTACAAAALIHSSSSPTSIIFVC